LEQSRLSKDNKTSTSIPKRPKFKDKLNPTKGELKALRRYERPLDGPKPAVSRRLGIIFTKDLVSGFKKRPPQAVTTSRPLFKYRPWVVQYDTRILPNHTLTVKQLARHKRLGIYNQEPWTTDPKYRIALNFERNQSTATSGCITSDKMNSSPYFRIMHKHSHTPLYHSEHWNKPAPITSIYYNKGTILPPDLHYSQFTSTLTSPINSFPDLPVPKAICLPDWFLNLPLQERR
jgi:hypothetical protein